MRAGVAVALFAASACWSSDEQITRLQARPATPTVAAETGAHALGLDPGRDGALFVPKNLNPAAPAPLIVLLHGAGQSSDLFRFAYPIAEELGVVVLALDSRDATWDGIRGSFGADVTFLDRALRHVFERVTVDPKRVALGGFSDGASYALSLGLINGDLFTHLVAFSPGFITAPAPRLGKPVIFISHGTQDRVLNIDRASRLLVPALKGDGYDVTYREFDGPHFVPEPIAREALAWLNGR